MNSTDIISLRFMIILTSLGFYIKSMTFRIHCLVLFNSLILLYSHIFSFFCNLPIISGLKPKKTNHLCYAWSGQSLSFLKWVFLLMNSLPDRSQTRKQTFHSLIFSCHIGSSLSFGFIDLSCYFILSFHISYLYYLMF